MQETKIDTMATKVEIKNLQQFLKTILGENIQILNLSTYHIVPPGENYGGEILAIDVLTQENSSEIKTKNFIAKLKPSNEMLGVMFNIQFTFKREVDIYQIVIPTLISFQKEYNIPKNKQLDFIPVCYGTRLNLSLNNNNEITNDALMLFENLKTQGYIMADRMEGFDKEHTINFLKNLARFHALPIALKILKPDLFKKQIKCLRASSFGDSYTSEMKQQFLNGLSTVINEIEDCKKYSNQIISLVDKGFKFEERFLEPNNLYATLVHHDLWTNNFLILKDKNEKFVKIKIYDFQLCSYGSLAHDILFFLFTSVQQEIFDSHYDDFIRIYYHSFIECLKEFGINTETFSWQSFIDEINSVGIHQLSHILIMLRPIFMQKNKLSDNSEMDEKELGAINELDSRYKIKLRNIILEFVKRKWL